ncbi:hypothetical protein DBR32_13455 [Taibaiella sp. KBW10]|uniref:hypothetical protein n=1 Tax=Taibaiella sp. KBW10 TaxID=2153357 RepID=UPI000F5B5C33|nr:hypothetical protein [Taibaiella sp. KBW10]RQO30558.1 hypothetical protein DBR32_13455 [Taibaiella sp. KBW10]
MKKLFLYILLLCSVTHNAWAQDTVQIYAFVNQLYNPGATFRLNIFKSDWGNFLLRKPYLIDETICAKIKNADVSDTTSEVSFAHWTETPKEVVAELYQHCRALDRLWQHRFLWQQAKVQKYLLVDHAKDKIPATVLDKLSLNAQEKATVRKHILDWNKTAIADRLINYCSIPVFTDDGNYALIVIGQDVRSEGGWDSIFIFKKTKGQWLRLDMLRLSEI